MLAGVKHVKLKYRSSGVDVAVALSEAASGCGALPPDGHGRMMSNGKRSAPSAKRVLLCVETLDKICLHPGFTPAEQKQLHLVVDHVKDDIDSYVVTIENPVNLANLYVFNDRGCEKAVELNFELGTPGFEFTTPTYNNSIS